MHTPTEDRPLDCESVETIRRVRQVLDDAGYSEDGVHEVLKLADWPVAQVRGPQNTALPLWLYLTRRPRPLHTLLRLFFLGRPVDREAVQDAVRPMSLAEWERVGLLVAEGPNVRASVDLFPVDRLLLVADSPWRVPPPANLVMNVSVSGLRLAHLAVRRPCGQALDLGTGCGLLAFLASPHCERVFATDVNPRAVNLAGFGAVLNGVSNATCLEGDRFRPVDGMRFDLIVTNPPFVISPSSGRMWRDSGMRGDQFCRQVVRAAPAYLNEGGFFQLIGNWVQRAGHDWVKDLAEWVDGTGCDAWALTFETFEPASYAMSWLDYRPGEPAEEKASQLAEWVEFLRHEGIEAIRYGVLTLRKQSGRPNWFACDEVPAPDGPCRLAVLDGFARRDALQACRDDQDLLAWLVKPSADLRLTQLFAPSDAGWSLEQARVLLAGGLGLGGAVDGAILTLLQRCRGPRRLGELLAELAQAQQWDVARSTPAFLRAARTLLEKGFLVPVLEDKLST